MDTSPRLTAPEGETWLGLSAAPLPVAEAVAWAVRPDCGGLVLFSGTARDTLKRSVPIWKRETWAGGESWGLEAQHIVDAGAG